MAETCPRPEYPRPQMRRDRWLSLNGVWEYEADPGDTGLERGLLERELRDRIVVPFAPECALSGVGDPDFHRAVWYRRNFVVPTDWSGSRVLLHFGAVDYDTTVWVNGREVGRHRGGYTSFSLDVTGALRPGKETVLVVRARDQPERVQPRGKQSDRFDPYGVLYPRTTGIWQSVWCEPLPETWLGRPRLTPDVDAGFLLEQPVSGTREASGLVVEALVRVRGREIATVSRPLDGELSAPLCLPIPSSERQLWSPETPYLYDIDILLRGPQGTLDRLQSYGALRSLGIGDGALLLNGRPRFQRLVLDQGYWPDGGLTAPSDEALARDITLAKEAGFDGARVHQRVAEERWLWHADRLGYLVWAEFPDWGNRAATAGELSFPLEYVTQWLEVLERDYSHPCIVGWCGLNETGQVLTDRLSALDDATHAFFRAAKLADRTRPVLDASGYSHRVAESDVWDCHDYEQDPDRFAAHHARLSDGVAFTNSGPHSAQWSLPWQGQPFLVSEFGGTKWVDGEIDTDAWGYGTSPSSVDELVERFGALCQALLGNPRVAGYCYTQLTDTYQETNGLLSFDRRPKADLSRFAKGQAHTPEIERRLTEPAAG